MLPITKSFTKSFYAAPLHPKVGEPNKQIWNPTTVKHVSVKHDFFFCRSLSHTGLLFNISSAVGNGGSFPLEAYKLKTKNKTKTAVVIIPTSQQL